jgi:hypothetical protein
VSTARREIWESLVSMLRVYANAASLGGRAYLVTSASDQAWVKHEGHVLDVCFRGKNGTWRLGQTQGEFAIEEDGTLMFPGGEKALDEAAIEWIESITQLGATNPRAASIITSG